MSDSPPASESAWLRLRKRLLSRTTDLIAIAIVIFAGISMGGSILEWWNTSPADVIGPNLNRSADQLAPPDWMSGMPVRIDAGDLNVRMQRSELTGSAEAVAGEMLTLLGEYAQKASLPDAKPTDEERALLRALKDYDPKWKNEAGVSVYHHDAPLAAYVAVKAGPASSQKGSLLSQARVVSWGLVVPAGESRWTAWLFAPRPQPHGRPSFDWRDILPEGARCDLALHSEEGQVMLSFSGKGNRRTWQAEFDRGLEQEQFQKTTDWSGTGNPRSVHYRSPLRQRVSIHIHEQDQSGRLQGLLHVSRRLEETP